MQVNIPASGCSEALSFFPYENMGRKKAFFRGDANSKQK